ncbi:hypothetical protein GCM10011608_09350 [Micromonospora sonchi]|uniref:Uncharacterized protein n=1 Tax=Micromonospora sonchi TaxID=1763543 RepID=A0A917TLC8_9ACTN|nr:hypothetical protein [Micromonospora sonchi]GGM26643.1 hypothetical protein GCM10011608_09350 [Micromonospora sonchi]
MTNQQTSNDSPWVAYLASVDGWVYQSAEDAADDLGGDGEVRIGVARGTCAPIEDDGGLRLPDGVHMAGDQVFELELYIDGEGNEAESAAVRFAQAKAMAAGLNAAAGVAA